MSCILIESHTTLKRIPIAYADVRVLNDYRLLLHTDGTYRVYLERREPNGTITAGYLYEGSSLETANKVWRKYSGAES